MESHTAAPDGPSSDLPAQEWITWNELHARDEAYRKAHRDRDFPYCNEMRGGCYSPTLDRWFWPPANGKIWLNAPRGTMMCSEGPRRGPEEGGRPKDASRSALVVDDVVLTADDLRELVAMARAARAARCSRRGEDAQEKPSE